MADEARYQLPTDNVVASGDLTLASGTEDADYPVSNLQGVDLYRPAKLTTATGAFLWEFGSPAQRIDLVALNEHNFDAGLEVRFQGNDTNVWTSPTLNALITIPAWRQHGSVRRPVRPWVDLTQVTGYTTAGFAYYRLVVVGTNSVNVALCPPWFGAEARALPINYQVPFRVTEAQPVTVHRTAAGIETLYDWLVRSRTFRALIGIDEFATLQAWHRACGGRYYAHVFIPDPTENEAWWVRFSGAQETETFFQDAHHEVPLELDELSPGLPL